jgi:benzoyl-CoA reductase/2-hydroxyglutaryl-CoA dehydratase subunit BcrC/BadD/HgdB
MNASGPKERATFSIASDVKRQLELTVPKTKRSSFVEDAIDRALRDVKKREALTAIRDFKPYPLKGPGVVETLREIRTQRDEELASRHGDE